MHFLTTHVDDCTDATDDSEIVVFVCFDEIAGAIPTVRLKATVGSIQVTEDS